MKCPKCGNPVPDGSLECPGCGVIFAKLKKLEERDKAQAEAALKQADAPEAAKPPAIDPWLGRKIAAGIIVAWLLSFGLYYRHAVRAARERALKTDIRTRPTVLMRDPVTGELKAVEVIVTPSRK